MDADQARLDKEIAVLTEQIDGSAAEIEQLEASQHSLTERGYELDRRGRRRRARPTVRPSNWSGQRRGNAATPSASMSWMHG